MDLHQEILIIWGDHYTLHFVLSILRHIVVVVVVVVVINLLGGICSSYYF
jgi:small-conductance mechanosensitive channel